MCSCLSAVIRGLLSQRAPERHSGSQLTFCQGARRDRQRFVGGVGGGSGGGRRCRANGEDRGGRCAASRPQQMLVQTAGTSVSLSESHLAALRWHLAPRPGSIRWQQILRTHAPRLHNVAGDRSATGLSTCVELYVHGADCFFFFFFTGNALHAVGQRRGRGFAEHLAFRLPQF